MKTNTKKIIAIVIVTTILFSLITVVYGSEVKSFFAKPTLNITDVNTNSSKAEKAPKAVGKSANTEKTPVLVSEEISAESNSEAIGKVGTAEQVTAVEEPNITQAKPTIPHRSLVEKSKGSTRDRENRVKLIDENNQLTPKQIMEYREAKFNKLKEKYPNEYKIISSKKDIDPYFYVSLLERIDYWNIIDLEAYLSDYIKDGFNGLDKHQKKVRERK